jgi:hypothetical protein
VIFAVHSSIFQHWTRDARWVQSVIVYERTTDWERQVLFPLKEQNSKQAYLHLLRSTNCTTLLASKQSLYLWQALDPEIEGYKISVLPDFEGSLVDKPVDNYPYTSFWQGIKIDPILIAQTSGTTGFLPSILC